MENTNKRKEMMEIYYLKSNKDADIGNVLIFNSDYTYDNVYDVKEDEFMDFFERKIAPLIDEARKNNKEPIQAAVLDYSNPEIRKRVAYAKEKADQKRDLKMPQGVYTKENTYKNDSEKVTPDIEKEDNNNLKYGIAGLAALAGIGGAAAYMVNKNSDEKKSDMEGKDWNYYLENAKESDQKSVMVLINDTLEKLNQSQTWMRINDGNAKWGITPNQALSLYTYFNDLTTEELASIYNGQTVNVDKIMEEADHAMIAMSFFYANDTIGDTTIANLFNDEVSKKLISDFTEIQARYNRATNDKERTAIAKEKKQMYYDYFMNNSSGKYVDVSSVPAASFIINTMFPVDFVRYIGSSADLREYASILVESENGQSKVDTACGYLKSDLEKYNEDIKALKAEYDAKKNSGFFRGTGKTEYEELIKDSYDPQIILDMMNNKLMEIDKYPQNVDLFNSTIDGERRLIPIGGVKGGSSSNTSSYSSSSGSSYRKPSSGTTTQSRQEFSAATPEQAAQQAIQAGATPEQIRKADEAIRDENEKARQQADQKVNRKENLHQDYYDDVYNGSMDKSEANQDLRDKLNSGEITQDEYQKIKDTINKAEKDKEEYDKAMDLDGTTTGGEITDNGSEINKDGSVDMDLDGDGNKEHIPSHNPNDPNNPYNMPEYADGAFDVEKNNSDDEIVYENQKTQGDIIDSQPPQNNPIQNQIPSENTQPSVDSIVQNPVTGDELEDMTFSDGVVNVGSSGGETTDFTEDQLVNQVKSSNEQQETVIEGEGLLSKQSIEPEAEEVVSFDDFLKQYTESEANAIEESVEQESVEQESVKTLK